MSNILNFPLAPAQTILTQDELFRLSHEALGWLEQLNNRLGEFEDTLDDRSMTDAMPYTLGDLMTLGKCILLTQLEFSHRLNELEKRNAQIDSDLAEGV